MVKGAKLFLIYLRLLLQITEIYGKGRHVIFWNNIMDAGRKKETRKMKEISKTRLSVNCSVTARNLRKSDLCGVIFGCTHNTINECFSKQLFG